MMTRWISVFTRYLRQLLSVLILGIVFFVLDMSGLVQVFLPDFRLTETIFIAVFLIAFVIANLKIYDEHEREIIQLKADKDDALNAVVQEIELNKASANHNASLRGPTASPGALPFIRLSDSSCRDVFLSGRFSFDNILLQAVREYLQTVSHINTLIANVEASTARFQNASDKVDAIRRYCNGQLLELDGEAKGLPSLMDDLQRLIAHESAAIK